VFVAKLVEIRIVYPNILGELELANEAGADHKGRNSALNAVPKRTFRQRRAVCRPAPDHPPSLNIRGGVTRVSSDEYAESRETHISIGYDQARSGYDQATGWLLPGNSRRAELTW
jgi:hypothetical protein